MGSVGIAIAPARMITSEQTLARIGRRMKVSTNTGIRDWGLGIRGGLGRRRRRPRALRRDWRAVGELLRAGDDDTLAGLDALEHRIVVAGDRADLDGALPGRQRAAGARLADEGKELAVD